jgi:CheY-like chemotaxis protein
MKRVLLIEDDLDQVDALKGALQLTDNVIEVATAGEEGIQKARTFHPDIVLCDLGLPDMDGNEVARRMRADPELQSIHLFALTAYVLPENREKSRQAGFESHLAKPPSIEDLEERIARAGPVDKKP